MIPFSIGMDKPTEIQTQWSTIVCRNDVFYKLLHDILDTVIAKPELEVDQVLDLLDTGFQFLLNYAYFEMDKYFLSKFLTVTMSMKALFSKPILHDVLNSKVDEVSSNPSTDARLRDVLLKIVQVIYIVLSKLNRLNDVAELQIFTSSFLKKVYNISKEDNVKLCCIFLQTFLSDPKSFTFSVEEVDYLVENLTTCRSARESAFFGQAVILETLCIAADDHSHKLRMKEMNILFQLSKLMESADSAIHSPAARLMAKFALYWKTRHDVMYSKSNASGKHKW